MKSDLKHIVAPVLLLFCFFISTAQTDSLSVKYKNTIRINLTPNLIIGPKSLVLGYERVVNNRQTFSLNIGYLEKKRATNKNGEPLNLFDESNNFGFAVAADYRFYFVKRNRFSVPDGLYWGPYSGYYFLGFEGKSRVSDGNGIESDVDLNSKFQLISVGVQLGYQFILLNDRLAIDLMLMGPSLTHYNLDMGFGAGYSLDPNSEYYDELKEILNYILPGSDVILDGQEFSQSGRLGFNHIGFRYGIQIGYRF